MVACDIGHSHRSKQQNSTQSGLLRGRPVRAGRSDPTSTIESTPEATGLLSGTCWPSPWSIRWGWSCTPIFMAFTLPSTQGEQLGKKLTNYTRIFNIRICVWAREGHSRWSVHCTAILSVLPPGRTRCRASPLRSITMFPAWLKQLQKLSQGIVLETVKRRSGSYRLARSRSEIALLMLSRKRAALDARRNSHQPNESWASDPKPCGIAAAVVAETA